MQKLNDQGPHGDVPVPDDFPDLVIIPCRIEWPDEIATDRIVESNESAG